MKAGYVRSARAAVLLMLAAGAASAETATASATGSFTAAQAQRGAATYAAACSLCHGVDMSGGPGSPALVGPEFAFGWQGMPVGDLLDYVKTNMPPGQAGLVSDQDYADAVAAVLKANGVEAGASEMPADPALLKQVTISLPN